MSIALKSVLKLALRELRGGIRGFRGFRIFLACLVLGTGIIAGVGTLATSITRGLTVQGQALLGGDIELALTQQPVSNAERAWLGKAGTVSELVSLRAMAYAPKADDRTLVEIRAVDAPYPLYGAVTLREAADIHTDIHKALARRNNEWGVVIAPELAERFGLATGDQLVLGDGHFRIRALLDKTPDGGTNGLALAPTVMIDSAALASTRLVQFGSLIRYYYRIRLPATTALATFKTGLSDAFPDAGWRVRDRTNGAPGVRRFVDRMSLFLSLVGLTALVVGGVGVGNAVRVYLDTRTDTIATLKILGASGSMIFAVYLGQILMLAAIGITLGLLLGAIAPAAFQSLLANHLPVPPAVGFYPKPLMLAAGYGGLITLAFSIWPLAQARDIPASGLFRLKVSGQNSWPRWPYLVVIAAAAMAFIGIAFAFSGSPRLSAQFTAAALFSFALLLATGWIVRKLAKMAPHVGYPGLRLAIANLHRPGAATGAVILSLGLGLTLFAALAQIEGNLSAQVQDQLPDEAPAFFFIDIQKNQIGDFTRTAEGLPGVSALTHVPYLRGKIMALDGTPVLDARVAPEARWAVRGDRGLTYSATLPRGNTLTAGKWWPKGYAGPPEISFDAGLAQGMGLNIGDTMTLNVLGRKITARIASLRQIDWNTLGVNFAIVFDPHTLSAAPHTYLASLKVPPSREAATHKALTRAFPNVSAVRMRDVLGTINKLLGEIGNAVRLTASVTILAGILVLAGAVAAGQNQRLYDATVLKILGATRRDILGIMLVEYLAVGTIAGLVAFGLGTAAAWGVITGVMEMSWAFQPGIAIVTLGTSLILTTGFGLVGTWAILRIRPATLLREAS